MREKKRKNSKHGINKKAGTLKKSCGSDNDEINQPQRSLSFSHSHIANPYVSAKKKAMQQNQIRHKKTEHS